MYLWQNNSDCHSAYVTEFLWGSNEFMHRKMPCESRVLHQHETSLSLVITHLSSIQNFLIPERKRAMGQVCVLPSQREDGALCICQRSLLHCLQPKIPGTAAWQWHRKEISFRSQARKLLSREREAVTLKGLVAGGILNIKHKAFGHMRRLWCGTVSNDQRLPVKCRWDS